MIAPRIRRFAQRRKGTPRSASNDRAAWRSPSRPNERRSSSVTDVAARRLATCRALTSTRSSSSRKRASTSGASPDRGGDDADAGMSLSLETIDGQRRAVNRLWTIAPPRAGGGGGGGGGGAG